MCHVVCMSPLEIKGLQGCTWRMLFFFSGYNVYHFNIFFKSVFQAMVVMERSYNTRVCDFSEVDFMPIQQTLTC